MPTRIVLFAPHPCALGSPLAELLRQAGHVVVSPPSAGAALPPGEEPDLLLVDGLPDGVHSTGELWDRLCGGRSRPVPRLLLTDTEPALNGGPPETFLLRPVSPTQLLSHVRALARPATPDLATGQMMDVLDHVPLAVSVKGPDGAYVLVNRAWEGQFHRPRGQVVGRLPTEVFPGEEGQYLLRRAREVLASGRPAEEEEVALLPDGLHTYIKNYFVLTPDGNGGDPYAVCGITTDITDRKKSEIALRDSEALYHSLVEALPVCLFRKDVDGRFTFANRPFCQELRRRPEEVLGRTDADFYPADLAAKYARDDREVRETGRVFEAVEENTTPEGERRFVQVIKAPLRSGGGEVIGLQAIFWDVSARLRAEADLARTSADLAVARRVQRRLFPEPQGDLVREAARHGLELGGVSFPAEGIGGDYFDYFRLAPSSGLGVAIGDVSGHGIGPALLMALARSSLRASAGLSDCPAEVLRCGNRVLYPDMEGDRYITLALAAFDLQARSFRYASAGHATGYVLGAEAQVKHVLDSTGVPLGIDPEATFESRGPFRLDAGDIVVLLTDGIAEARDPQGQPFTPQRVLDLVRCYRGAPAGQIAENLYHGVRAFAQNEPQVDDITATVIKAL